MCGSRTVSCGAARLFDAELAADHVGAQLGHAAQRGGLPAGDRHESFDAVSLAVIECLERARQLAPGGGAGGADQRPRRRPRRPARQRVDGARESTSNPRCTSARRGPRARRGHRDPRPPRRWSRRSTSQRCRTTMSPSPDLCIRLITMLQNRPRSARSTPGEGAIGTLAPAIAATFPDHGPAALTTRSAWISPVLAGHVVADGSARHARRRGRAGRSPPCTAGSRAPLWRAVAKNRSTSRIGSTVASGTRTAASNSGFRLGSECSASCGVQPLHGNPGPGAAFDQRFEILEVLVAHRHEQARRCTRTCRERSARRIMFSRMHSTPASRSPTA